MNICNHKKQVLVIPMAVIQKLVFTVKGETCQAMPRNAKDAGWIWNFREFWTIQSIWEYGHSTFPNILHGKRRRNILQVMGIEKEKDLQKYRYPLL